MSREQGMLCRHRTCCFIHLGFVHSLHSIISISKLGLVVPGEMLAQPAWEKHPWYPGC